jgi:hypothetical protein
MDRVEHYLPGTQEKYNSFSSRDLMMEKGKELECPEGRGGGKGLEILRISEEPGVPPRVEQLKSIQSEGLELFRRKNADYGDAFAKYGVLGVLMRIEDKIQRSLSITKNGVNLVNDEGIRDTLLDLHNYAAMALMLLEDSSVATT